ncbi:hypothetical protein MJO29_001447, partial [Puccinia striiformis f. sp. tritici]
MRSRSVLYHPPLPNLVALFLSPLLINLVRVSFMLTTPSLFPLIPAIPHHSLGPNKLKTRTRLNITTRKWAFPTPLRASSGPTVSPVSFSFSPHTIPTSAPVSVVPMSPTQNMRPPNNTLSPFAFSVPTGAAAPR